MKTLVDLLEAGVSGRTVLVRSDLNVPLDGTRITDDGRIRASVPTLRTLVDAGARVVVTAHLGRPKPGADNSKYSLAPVAARLGELLGTDVALAPHGDEAKAVVDRLESGGVVLLENIRFDPRARVTQLLQRGHGGADAPVVGDRGAVQGDVQVGAHEDAPTLRGVAVELGDQVVEGLHSLDATSPTRSTSRLL